jgi:putative serine/threonine protein kinase
MEPGNTDVTRNILTCILTDCYRLDQIGLDHGELSQASKHIIIEKSARATILDFESSSLGRRAANLTSACQYLFLSTQPGDKLREIIQVESKNVIIDALRLYKRRPGLETLKKVMLTFRLDSDSVPTSI